MQIYLRRHGIFVKMVAAILAAAFLFQDIAWADPDVVSPKIAGETLAPQNFIRSSESPSRAAAKYIECMIESNRSVSKSSIVIKGIGALLRHHEKWLADNGITVTSSSDDILISFPRENVTLRYYDSSLLPVKEGYEAAGRPESVGTFINKQVLIASKPAAAIKKSVAQAHAAPVVKRDPPEKPNTRRPIGRYRDRIRVLGGVLKSLKAQRIRYLEVLHRWYAGSDGYSRKQEDAAEEERKIRSSIEHMERIFDELALIRPMCVPGPGAGNDELLEYLVMNAQEVSAHLESMLGRGGDLEQDPGIRDRINGTVMAQLKKFIAHPRRFTDFGKSASIVMGISRCERQGGKIIDAHPKHVIGFSIRKKLYALGEQLLEMKEQAARISYSQDELALEPRRPDGAAVEAYKMEGASIIGLGAAAIVFALICCNTMTLSTLIASSFAISTLVLPILTAHQIDSALRHRTSWTIGRLNPFLTKDERQKLKFRTFGLIRPFREAKDIKELYDHDPDSRGKVSYYSYSLEERGMWKYIRMSQLYVEKENMEHVSPMTQWIIYFHEWMHGWLRIHTELLNVPLTYCLPWIPVFAAVVPVFAFSGDYYDLKVASVFLAYDAFVLFTARLLAFFLPSRITAAGHRTLISEYTKPYTAAETDEIVTDYAHRMTLEQSTGRMKPVTAWADEDSDQNVVRVPSDPYRPEEIVVVKAGYTRNIARYGLASGIIENIEAFNTVLDSLKNRKKRAFRVVLFLPRFDEKASTIEKWRKASYDAVKDIRSRIHGAIPGSRVIFEIRAVDRNITRLRDLEKFYRRRLERIAKNLLDTEAVGCEVDGNAGRLVKLLGWLKDNGYPNLAFPGDYLSKDKEHNFIALDFIMDHVERKESPKLRMLIGKAEYAFLLATLGDPNLSGWYKNKILEGPAFIEGLRRLGAAEIEESMPYSRRSDIDEAVTFEKMVKMSTGTLDLEKWWMFHPKTIRIAEFIIENMDVFAEDDHHNIYTTGSRTDTEDFEWQGLKGIEALSYIQRDFKEHAVARLRVLKMVRDIWAAATYHTGKDYDRFHGKYILEKITGLVEGEKRRNQVLGREIIPDAVLDAMYKTARTAVNRGDFNGVINDLISMLSGTQGPLSTIYGKVFIEHLVDFDALEPPPASRSERKRIRKQQMLTAGANTTINLSVFKRGIRKENGWPMSPDSMKQVRLFRKDGKLVLVSVDSLGAENPDEYIFMTNLAANEERDKTGEGMSLESTTKDKLEIAGDLLAEYNPVINYAHGGGFVRYTENMVYRVFGISREILNRVLPPPLTEHEIDAFIDDICNSGARYVPVVDREGRLAEQMAIEEFKFRARSRSGIMPRRGLGGVLEWYQAPESGGFFFPREDGAHRSQREDPLKLLHRLDASIEKISDSMAEHAATGSDAGIRSSFNAAAARMNRFIDALEAVDEKESERFAMLAALGQIKLEKIQNILESGSPAEGDDEYYSGLTGEWAARLEDAIADRGADIEVSAYVAMSEDDLENSINRISGKRAKELTGLESATEDNASARYELLTGDGMTEEDIDALLESAAGRRGKKKHTQELSEEDKMADAESIVRSLEDKLVAIDNAIPTPRARLTMSAAAAAIFNLTFAPLFGVLEAVRRRKIILELRYFVIKLRAKYPFDNNPLIRDALAARVKNATDFLDSLTGEINGKGPRRSDLIDSIKAHGAGNGNPGLSDASKRDLRHDRLRAHVASLARAAAEKPVRAESLWLKPRRDPEEAVMLMDRVTAAVEKAMSICGTRKRKEFAARFDLTGLNAYLTGQDTPSVNFIRKLAPLAGESFGGIWTGKSLDEVLRSIQSQPARVRAAREYMGLTAAEAVALLRSRHAFITDAPAILNRYEKFKYSTDRPGKHSLYHYAAYVYMLAGLNGISPDMIMFGRSLKDEVAAAQVTGDALKKIWACSGSSVKEFAEKLGIKEYALYSMFNGHIREVPQDVMRKAGDLVYDKHGIRAKVPELSSISGTSGFDTVGMEDATNPFIREHIAAGSVVEISYDGAVKEVRLVGEAPRAPPEAGAVSYEPGELTAILRTARDPALLRRILHEKDNFRNMLPMEEEMISAAQKISISIVRDRAFIAKKGGMASLLHVRTGVSRHKHGLDPTIWIGELLLRRLDVEEVAQVLLEECQHIIRPPEQLPDGSWIYADEEGSTTDDPVKMIYHDRDLRNRILTIAIEEDMKLSPARPENAGPSAALIPGATSGEKPATEMSLYLPGSARNAFNPTAPFEHQADMPHHHEELTLLGSNIRSAIWKLAAHWRPLTHAAIGEKANASPGTVSSAIAHNDVLERALDSAIGGYRTNIKRAVKGIAEKRTAITEQNIAAWLSIESRERHIKIDAKDILPGVVWTIRNDGELKDFIANQRRLAMIAAIARKMKPSPDLSAALPDKAGPSGKLSYVSSEISMDDEAIAAAKFKDDKGFLWWIKFRPLESRFLAYYLAERTGVNVPGSIRTRIGSLPVSYENASAAIRQEIDEAIASDAEVFLTMDTGCMGMDDIAQKDSSGLEELAAYLMWTGYGDAVSGRNISAVKIGSSVKYIIYDAEAIAFSGMDNNYLVRNSVAGLVRAGISSGAGFDLTRLLSALDRIRSINDEELESMAARAGMSGEYGRQMVKFLGGRRDEVQKIVLTDIGIMEKEAARNTVLAEKLKELDAGLRTLRRDAPGERGASAEAVSPDDQNVVKEAAVMAVEAFLAAVHKEVSAVKAVRNTAPGPKVLIAEELFSPEDAEHLRGFLRGRFGNDSPIQIVAAGRIQDMVNRSPGKDKTGCIIGRNDYDRESLRGKINGKATTLVLGEDLRGDRYLHIEGVVGLVCAMMAGESARGAAVRLISMIFKGVEGMDNLALIDLLSSDPRAFADIIRFKPVNPADIEGLDQKYRLAVEQYLIMA